jgi:hypothetical protein
MNNVKQAIDYVNANLAAIGSAARMQNPAALDVQAAYAQLAQYRNVVSEELLVNAVAEWQDYQAENPNAEV